MIILDRLDIRRLGSAILLEAVRDRQSEEEQRAFDAAVFLETNGLELGAELGLITAPRAFLIWVYQGCPYDKRLVRGKRHHREMEEIRGNLIPGTIGIVEL